ncbi:IS5 family transposase [Endozoicomonadaceae bacterium StTr2]
MDRTRLLDDQWLELLSLLNLHSQIRIGDHERCRAFIEAVLWILRTGSQWRLLPEERGHWNSVFKRYSRWCQYGVWSSIHEFLAKQSDFEYVSIDSTVVRAHACSAGAQGSSATLEALGRSRGGFSCKVHALMDALGLPVRFILTGGQAADITQAVPLIEDIETAALLADKGYDADTLLQWLSGLGIQAVIPPKANRRQHRACDWWLYKERHGVECMFGKLKHYRRIASRFDKKAINYMGMLALAATMLWLR